MTGNGNRNGVWSKGSQRSCSFAIAPGETELGTDHAFQLVTESQPEFFFTILVLTPYKTKPLQKCRGFVVFSSRRQAKGFSGIKQYADPATPQDADLPPARESALHPSVACAPAPNPAKSALMPRSICTS